MHTVNMDELQPILSNEQNPEGQRAQPPSHHVLRMASRWTGTILGSPLIKVISGNLAFVLLWEKSMLPLSVASCVIIMLSTIKSCADRPRDQNSVTSIFESLSQVSMGGIAGLVSLALYWRIREKMGDHFDLLPPAIS